MRTLKKPERRFSSQIAWTKQKRLHVYGGVLLLVTIVLIGLIAAQKATASHKIVQEIDDISKPNLTCKQVLTQIGGIADYSKYNTAAKKKLLEKQMFCFSDQLQFDKAIASAKKLETIYASEKDTVNLKRIKTSITNMQQTQAELKRSQ